MKTKLSERDRVLLERLREPAPVGARFGINRYVYDIYRNRTDLLDGFPDLDTDGAAYVEWLHAYGREQLSLIDELLPPAPVEYRHLDPRVREPGEVLPRHVGINVTGFLQAELGIGEAARLIIAALDARRIPVLPVEPATRPPSRHGHQFDTVPPQLAGFPITLTCANPDWLGVVAREAGPDFFRNRYSIGYWWWEVDGPTPFDWRVSYDLVDEVWVASEHVASNLRPELEVPIVTMPLPVSVPDPPPLDREQLGLPRGFLFLCMFDYASAAARKNPLGTVEAFRRAFGPDDGAVLALKCINPEHDPEYHAQLHQLAAERPDIVVLDHYMSPGEKNALVAACDCYASLHRAEGFGLPLAEAMYLGKPTIATGYSGNLEFMTSENSHLVSHAMVNVGSAGRQYPATGVWAEPDLDHAAALMRSVFADPDGSRALGERAARDIRRTHSVEAAGAAMERRIALIVESRGIGAESPAAGRSTNTAAGELLARGPTPPAGSSIGRLGAPARRLLLRALRPFTAYQHQLDEELLRELVQLRSQLTALELRLAAAKATELLASRTPRHD